MSADEPEPPTLAHDGPAERPTRSPRGRASRLPLIAALGVLMGAALLAGYLAAAHRGRAASVSPAASPAGRASVAAPVGQGPTGSHHEITAYVRAGCPRCAAAKEFLAALASEQPDLVVTYRDVVQDPKARADLEELAEERALTAISVPVFLAGNDVIVGFVGPESTGNRIRQALQGNVGPAVSQDDIEFGTCEGDVGSSAEASSAEAFAVTVPVLGAITPQSFGLPAFTVALGLLDGFNPCAMWVLLFLLSLLVNMHDRRKMFLVAGTFVLISGIVYYAFMSAWLGVFMVIGISPRVTLALGLFALVVGIVNVKDYFAFGRWVSFSIPDSRKPAIYARARKVMTAENVGVALVSVATMAVMVNMVELLCTAGLPAIYTQVLAANDLSPLQRHAYLAMYNVFYMLDDSIMVIVAVITLSQTRLQEKGGRALKLVSGVVMLVLAALLIFRPEWLAALG